MLEVYDATALTPLKVARSSGYIDWASQPTLFKRYPDFLYRCSADGHPELLQAVRARRITSEKAVGNKPYYQLSIPSAGNLHPLELYVQIRGVKGVLSGIYHVDPLKEELVLLRECGGGLEPLVGLEHRFDGLLYILSVVPFRSEWKYGERAWRYCYMDAGHQLGALCAAQEAPVRLLPDIDRVELNRFMGFDGQEFVCAAVAAGSESDKPAALLKTPLMRVAPTDYCESVGVVPDWIARSQTAHFALERMRTDAGESVQQQRRSARTFADTAMPTAAFEHIMHTLQRIPEGLTAHAVVLRSEHAEPGLYGGSALLRAGAFADTLVALLVDQRFVGGAEIIMVLSAETYDADRQMAAAAFAHMLSLDAAERGAGYSAIGAFYDKKMQNFLGTSDAILYVGVFGMERT